MIEREKILRAAIETLGQEAQIMMAIEEMSELTKALCKLGRTRAEDSYEKAVRDVIEEIADVRIMIDQLNLIFGSSEAVEDEKLVRLEKRIREAASDSESTITTAVLGDAVELAEGSRIMIRPCDTVKHIPTGEEWVVCGINYEQGYLIPCGYPFPSRATIADCELIEARGFPQTEEGKQALRRYDIESYIEKEADQ